MLKEIEAERFKQFFPSDPHQFISQPFLALNKAKVERIINLVDETENPVIGLIAGIKERQLLSPFSAPFGGFHYRSDNIYISEIDNFVNLLKGFIIGKEYKGIELTLPPDIYHQSFNAKMVSSLIRNGFDFLTPEITGWIDLNQFNGNFSQKNSREYYRQAVRHGLVFDLITDLEGRRRIFELILENRAKFGRPIHMKFEDILDTGRLWPIDFFSVLSSDGNLSASAIFYRNHPEVCYAVFWGDSESGRPLRAMDFLLFNLLEYYKMLGFRYMDLGISTEAGKPNEGLLRFKESHNSTSSLKYRFVWNVP